MGIFRKAEKKLEGAVEGGFGRAFKSSVQPVELAHKLTKEMGDHKTVGVSNVYVPNEFEVYLGSADFEHLSSLGDSLKAELADMDEALKEAKKQARFAPTLPEKLERQRAARKLEEKREEAWRAYDEASRDIDRQKDQLLDEIGRRLEQSVEQTPLFTMRWRLT